MAKVKKAKATTITLTPQQQAVAKEMGKDSLRKQMDLYKEYQYLVARLGEEAVNKFCRNLFSSFDINLNILDREFKEGTTLKDIYDIINNGRILEHYKEVTHLPQLIAEKFIEKDLENVIQEVISLNLTKREEIFNAFEGALLEPTNLTKLNSFKEEILNELSEEFEGRIKSLIKFLK